VTTPTRNVSASSSELGISDLERIDAIFTNPDLYRLPDGCPVRNRTLGGRPQLFPEWFVIAFGCLTSTYKSARAATTALRGPIVWDHVRVLVRTMCPNEPEKWLPDQPPSRTWYIKRKNRMKNGGLEPLRRALTENGVATARELGLLDPDGFGSQAHPDANRMIHADGRAIRQIFNGAPGDTRQITVTDPTTGETRIEQRSKRADPDAKVHVTGDNRQIHGCKFWHAEVRGDKPFTRVFLSVDHVPEVKDEKNSEGDIAVKNLLALAPLVPGATGAMFDTVLRGTHVDRLERSTGWIILNPVTAKSVDKKTNERVEKDMYLRTVQIKHPDGGADDVAIWICGGRLARLEFTEDGTEILVPLERVGNPVRHNPNGDYRTYVEYRVPSPRGGRGVTIREATYNRPEDTFNRAENLRQIPPGDPDYQRLIGRRSDAEAANRIIDDHLYLRRAISVGAQGQLFDLICHAFLQNSLARYRHSSRGRPDPAIAA
jgi:hypothetical protein